MHPEASHHKPCPITRPCLGWLLLSLVLAIPAQARPQQNAPLAESTQLLVVTTPNWTATDGALQRYQRANPKKKWQPVGDPIPVVVGQTGLGWGLGVLPIPAHDPADPIKHEGDRRAPAGIFRLGTSFGFAPRQPAAWKMPYLPLTSSIECVDDSHSKFYNRVVNRESVAPDWNSSEHLRSETDYRWGAVIDQNPGAVPQAGSCVFMHIKGGGDAKGTVGCTAMAEPNVEAVLAWLQPAAHPLLVQMPATQYRQIEKALHLPPR